MMPLTKVKKKGQIGWKWGESGKSFFGPGAKAKARKQMRAILATGWTENYNPSQPRDSKGRWGSGGGGGGGSQEIQLESFREIDWQEFRSMKHEQDKANRDELFRSLPEGIEPESDEFFSWMVEQNKKGARMQSAVDQHIQLSGTLNEPLRSGGEMDDMLRDRLKAMDDAMDSPGSKLAKDMTLYRSVTAGQLDEIQSGKVSFVDQGFPSTAYDRSSAELIGGESSVIVLRAPKGTKAILGSPNEAEVILARGSRFIKLSDGSWLVDNKPPTLNVSSKKKRTVNPLKLDPTRSATLRRKFTAEIARRLNLLKRRVRKLVAEDDAFGLGESDLPPFVENSFVVNQRWKFHTSQQKLHLFQTWLHQQLIDVFLGDETTTEDDWWAEYIREGYRKGAGRAFDDVRKPYARGYASDESTADFYDGSKYDFLQSSFANPQRKEKVLLLASRTFTDLKGVTEQMATVMSRTLVDGFVQGKSPWDVAKDLERNVDGIGRNRANTIARTECLPAETLVDRAVVRAIFRRWYDGDMVEVITANGRKFSATPNHPMLTKDGWISAGLLKQGDDLVRDAREQDLGSFGDQDKHSGPTTLGEIYRSLSIVGIPERTTCSPNDFHGDGMDGDVDILRPDRELMVGRFSPIFEPLAKDVFSESGFRDSTFCPFCGCLLSINQQSCFCGRSKTNPIVDESSFDDSSFDSSGDCDFGDRFTSCISGCDVFHIDAVDELVGNTSFLPRESLSFGVGSADPGFSQDVADSLLIGVDPFSDFPLGQSGLMEGDDQFLPFVVEADSDFALLQCFDGCFGVGSGDPRVLDHPSDMGSVEPDFDRYVSDGEPLLVQFDRVVSVNVRHFSGHVYNLETPFGYYTIDSLFTGNTIRAHAEGQLDAFDDLGVEEVGAAVEWATAEDDRVCRLCSALHGVVMKVNEARGLIPRHPQCVIGDTRVWSPSPTAILRAEYSGQIFEIVTAKGRSLSVTENHVLLTHRGWVRAKEITEGDHLVDASTLDGEVFQHPYYDENVPCIADLHASLLKEGRVGLQASSNTRPEDLHGDGKSINCKIDIASLDGLLWNEWESQFGGKFRESSLMLRDVDMVQSGFFVGQCVVSSMLIAMGASADSFMGFDSVSSIFLRGSFAHHQLVGLVVGSDMNPGGFNSITNESPFVSMPSGKLGEGNTALVFFDHLLKDIRRNFDAGKRQSFASSSDDSHRFETFADAFAIALKSLGDLPGGKTGLIQTNDLSHDRVDFTRSWHVTNLPVYDMETQETVYIANGILSSNCRCAWLPANVGEDHAGQKRTKTSIGKAIDESVRREIPVRSGRTLDEQLELTKWGGPDADVDKSRPKSILDNVRMIDSDWNS